MRNLVSELEQWLPHWLEKTQMLWLQWVYALWQLVRCNPLTLLILSFLPFYFMQKYHKKAVVVLSDSKDYDTTTCDEMRDYFAKHPVKSLELKQQIGYWHFVKHRGYFYLTHQNTPCELAKCFELFGEDNIIFVERLLTITGSVAVGKRLSQTEAYERIFSKSYHCGKGSDYVIPTAFDYVDLSSKLWIVLSSIPILLQARNYNKLSNLLTLVIILLDLNRVRLFNLYGRLFDGFTKFVKLKIFKERTDLYNFFSIFSSRWRYCDTVKKYSYVRKSGEKILLSSYNKLESMNDVTIEGWHTHNRDANDQHICMEIVKDRAHCSLMGYGGVYARAVLNKDVYVSDHSLGSEVKLQVDHEHMV